MELTLQRCRIRPWRMDDLPALVRHANNREVWINLRDRFPHPYTPEAGRAWIEECVADAERPVFAIEVDDEAVGAIGIIAGEDVHRLTGEIGFWLGEQHWGRGIVTEAVRAMTDHAFRDLGLCRVHAQVYEWNPASMRVLEKAGYVREGRLRRSAIKDGRVLDTVLYAITRDPGDGPHGPR